MSIKYHGNYCGPGWSAGQYQNSVVSDVPAIDELDECCREHDAAYYYGKDLIEADNRFSECAQELDPFASSLVKFQSTLRTALKQNPMTKKNSLRGASKAQVKTQSTYQNKQKLNSGNDSKFLAPAAVATKRTGKAPKMSSGKDGSIKINHRAFITPIECETNFNVIKLPCNPGLASTFPWLSRLANRYEEYRFVSLKYSYRSVTATSSNGVIMMSFDFDASDPTPSSKAQQSQTIPNSEVNSWMSNDLIVKPENNWRFVRPGNLAANLDIKTYDMGNLFVSSLYGSGLVTGELYVEYIVELRKPTSGNLDSGKITSQAVSFASPFVGGLTFHGYPPLQKESSNTLQFTSSGEWLVAISITGTGLTAGPTEPTVITTGSGEIRTLYNIVSSTACDRLMVVRADFGDILQFISSGVGTTIDGLFVRLSPCDYSTMT